MGWRGFRRAGCIRPSYKFHNPQALGMRKNKHEATCAFGQRGMPWLLLLLYYKAVLWRIALAHQQKSAERALSQRARHVQDKVDEGQVNDLAI